MAPFSDPGAVISLICKIWPLLNCSCSCRSILKESCINVELLFSSCLRHNVAMYIMDINAGTYQTLFNAVESANKTKGPTVWQDRFFSGPEFLDPL